MHDKQLILQALKTFVSQRPGLEFANYGDVAAYRAEQRGITRDLAHVQALMRAVDLSGIGGDRLFESQFGSRLTIKPMPESSIVRYDIEYRTGQYFPTEYRKAVCAVLSSALWDYYRDGLTGKNIGDQLRNHFRKQFSRNIAKRWFS